MRIVIYAREASDAGHIERLLHRKLREFFADVQVERRKDSESLGDAAFAFVDADAPRGLSTALRWRSEGMSAPIVFFSDSHMHALSCYEAHPAGYLVKPFAYEQLCRVLDWHRNAFTPALRRLDVVSGRTLVRVYLADVIYVEIQAHKCLIHRKGDVIALNRSLASIEAQLEGEAFLRVHRKYLANLAHIAGMTHDSFRMDNGHFLPIGTVNETKIKEAYLAFKLTADEYSARSALA